MQSSILITGPSASGKSTLHCCLTSYFGLIPTPVHTTRPLRSGEVQGIDIFHVSQDVYLNNFSQGLYLEESPDAAFFGGSYYGTPKKWITETESQDFNCFVCPTVNIARQIKKELRGKILWIHLFASESVRCKRIAKRNPEIAQEHLKVRLDRGNQKVDITGHDYCIDTSYLGAYSIFDRVIRNLHSPRETSDHKHLCVES